MQSMGVCSINHDTTTSYRLSHIPFSLKFTPTPCTRITARVYPYAHPQHLKVLKQFVYIQSMDVECIQWGLAASTMTPQHHTGSAILQFWGMLLLYVTIQKSYAMSGYDVGGERMLGRR
jgi:hypothetical protein